MNKCCFCEKTYKTRSSYRDHMKTRPPKFCLLIREKRTCSKCKEIIPTNESMDNHQSVCNPKQFYYRFFEVHGEETSKLRATIRDLELKLQVQEKMYIKDTSSLQEQLNESKEIIKEYRELNKDLLKKNGPTTINNITTTNTTNFLDKVNILKLDSAYIKDQVDENFSIAHFLQGIDGVASFTNDYIIRDATGKLLYVPSDTSRLTFKYNAENGVSRDVKASNLINSIHPPIMNKIKDDIFSYEKWKNGEYKDTMDEERIDEHFLRLEEIQRLPKKSTKFCKSLIQNA